MFTPLIHMGRSSIFAKGAEDAIVRGGDQKSEKAE